MKKGKTRKLTRRILSFVLTTALVVGLMPGNILTVSAEGTDTVISDELIVESVSSNDASSATECTCETDDPAFHATNCPAYIAPENPQCFCAEKCTDDTLNVWCDVCGVQGVSACQGEDTAVVYTDVVASITNGETVTNYATFGEALANWTDGTTLTLLADVTGLTECIETYAKGLSLDLNGHKIECSDNWTIWIDGASGSELTIRDSNGGGYIQGVVYAVAGGSKLCLESGTVETVDANGDFTMTGGQIISEDGSGLGVNGEDDVVISGGEIYGSRCGVWITNGNVIISGDTKITGAGQYAIRSSYSAEVVISGTPTISGETGEFDLGSKITLNTQPANGEVWRVKIDTGEITDGIFAVPGEDIALDASKFASAMDGYEVKQNAKGELLLCNHTEQTAASNGDGTHNTTCNCGEATFDTNVACSGGVATDTHQAYCEYCNAPYGELNPDVHCDIIALTMTTEELEDALLELLNSGETDISIVLAAKADEEMFTAINTALCSSTAAEGSVNLTIAGVQVVTSYALGNGDPDPEFNTDPVALKTLSFPDAVTLEFEALVLPNVQAVYLPKVTEWEIWGIRNADNISTLVLTAQGTITADFTSLSTYDIDLTLHCNKINDVTDGTTWQGVTWKSISFDHSYTCTATSANVITKECANCGKSGTLTITAEGGVYDGTTAYGATVEKTGIFENEEVTVNYYQGDTLIGTDAPVNAGTYTAKITYEDVTASCQFEITKATPTAEMFTYIESAVYDGTEKSADVVEKDGITGMGEITVKYYQNDIEVTPVNAGTYTVKIDVADGDIYDAATDIEVGTFTITKATPTFDMFTATPSSELVYDGTEKSIIVTTDKVGMGTFTVSYISVTDSTQPVEPVEAGLYIVLLHIEEGDNYIADDTLSFVPFEIRKADSVITAAPTPADLVYDGTAQNLINAGTATGGEMQYSLDGTNYSSAIPTGTDAGEYTVWYKVVGDKNHNDTEPASIEVTIAKGTPDIGTVSASNLENTLDVSEVVLSRSNETVHGTLSLAEGTTLQYGIHDYTYVFKSGDANYNDVEGTVSITILDTIAPTATYKVGTDGWKQFINTITFGHFCKDYTTVDIIYSDEGSGVADKQYYISEEEITNTENIQWSDYTDTLNINATGKYYIYVKVTDKGGNEVILNSEGIVVYAESVITPTSFSCEYGEENNLYVNISTNGNTFANLTDGSGNEIATENYSIEGSTLTIKGEYLSDLDVGEYTYKICMNPQGVENTEVTLAYSFVVNVTAKELTVTGATAASRDYIANDKTVDITGVTLSGIQGTDDVSVEITGLKGTLSGANAADYTEVTLPELKLSGADKDNYVLTQPSKAVPTNVTISPQAIGTAQNVTKKYLFSQENADTINLVSLLPKDCGTVVSYGTPAVDGNVTYKVAPSIEEGTLAYTVADGSEEIVGNKGTITIDVKTQNYTSVSITISVALVDQIPVNPQTEVTLKEESQKLTYGQKLSALELTEVVFKGTDGETVTGTLQWKNGDSIPTVDTKKASWEFVPSASYNDKYATAEGELTISVVPATPVVDTLPTVNAITYHPDTTLADIALSGGKMNGIAGELTGTWAWKDATICPKAGDNTYVAVFTPEDGTNYKTKEVDITVSVAKATPYIKTAVAADAITYGEALKNSALSGGVVQYSETDETAVAGSWSWKEVTTKPVVADSKVTEYDVVFTPTDAENYNKVETKITLTVIKAETTPNMPESTMSALYSQKTVGALELPEGWVWNEADSAKELTVDVAVEATAIYNGADKGNYVTESVTISITRQACDHEESDILYTGEGEKAPTCTVDGIGHTECTKCKEPMQTNVTVEASGHTGGTATCKNKAECSVCHEGYGELDKNNHAGETEIKDAKKATCAVDGYTGDTYCKDCGAKIATGTKIDKSTAHTWDNGVVTKEATATEKGEKTYTCSVCKTTKKEEIPALGAPKVGEEIASEDGSATYKVTEAGENGNLVTYEAPTDKNQATVVVPATVTINNITYNVTTISDTAFAGNKKLTSVTIGDNVTGFSDKTFKGCSNLKTVDVGNGVTSIPANAFKNFKNLTTVKMGTGVKTIGKNAFYGCKKLKNLTIGKNVVTIGDKAFYKCTSLTKVTIPSKVKTIGKSTFEGCKALKTITIGKSVTKIGSKAFYGCSKTKTLTIKSSKLTTKKIGSKAFTKTPKSMTVKVPKKKFKAYKSMFIKRGVNKKARFKKS